jgi:hypothetical protein
MSDLSPTAIVRTGDLFVAIRCYFDGGNLHETEGEITLAGIVGNEIQWKNLERRWEKHVEKHRAKFVHTTDAIALQNEFSKDKGWCNNRVRHLMSDSVSIILECLAKIPDNPDNPSVDSFQGIMPFTITVRMDDFKRALGTIPDLGTPEGACAMTCVDLCFQYGVNYLRGRRFNLIFDRGEPFYGHLKDRQNNKASLKIDPIWEKTALTELNMRELPGLQVADVFAWATNARHRHGRIEHEWQERLLAKHREDRLLSYERLLKPNLETIDLVKSWRLPRRRSPLWSKRGKMM